MQSSIRTETISLSNLTSNEQVQEIRPARSLATLADPNSPFHVLYTQEHGSDKQPISRESHSSNITNSDVTSGQNCLSQKKKVRDSATADQKAIETATWIVPAKSYSEHLDDLSL